MSHNGKSTAAEFSIIIFIGLVYVSFFPYFPKIHSANELSRLYLAMAVVDRGDISISKEIEKYGDILDKSSREGNYYSDKPPGTAFLSVPFLYLKRLLGGEQDLQRDLRLARIVVSIIPTLIMLILLTAYFRKTGIEPSVRQFLLLACGLGTPVFTYSMLFYGHELTAVLLFIIFFIIFITENPSKLTSLLFGFLSSLAVMTEYQAVIYLVPLIMAFLIRIRMKPVLLLIAAAGGIPLIALLLYYHYLAFGNVLNTGYNFLSNQFFASVHKKGFMGISSPHLDQLGMSLFSSSKGLLFFSPFLITGFLGIPLIFSNQIKRWSEKIVLFFMIILPLFFVSCMIYWDGGWTVSQRHLTPVVPFLMIPSALIIQRFVWIRPLGILFSITSTAVTGLATIVFPHLPEDIANPFHQVIVPLVQEGYFPYWLGDHFRLHPLAGISAIMLIIIAAYTVFTFRWFRGKTVRSVIILLMIAVPCSYIYLTSFIKRNDSEKERLQYFHDVYEPEKSPGIHLFR